MSSDRTPGSIPTEEAFLARLVDVSPIEEHVEQVHLAAALAAVREAGETAEPSRRTPPRPTTPLWRKPRMALAHLAAVIAGLSLPAKAFAATAVAAATIGGGVAVTSAPPEDPPTDTPAAEALLEASDNTGFPLPARGEPDREGELEATVEDEVEAQDEHGIDGPTQAEAAKTMEDGRTFGADTSDAASDGQSTEARADAEQAAADATAKRAEAQERREAAEQAEADAAAQRAEAEQRRTDARNNATADDSADDETEADDEADDQSETGAERSGARGGNADAAPGR